jgi:hypothetical protein
MPIDEYGREYEIPRQHSICTSYEMVQTGGGRTETGQICGLYDGIPAARAAHLNTLVKCFPPPAWRFGRVETEVIDEEDDDGEEE